MTYRTDMEAAFEEWWAKHRQRTWARTRITGDPVEHPKYWGYGHRDLLREGWMGAVLWCRLCQKEHEGACISRPADETKPTLCLLDKQPHCKTCKVPYKHVETDYGPGWHQDCGCLNSLPEKTSDQRQGD